MKKGIIMEVHKRFLTILTPQGEFLRARNLKENYQIGQEIDFFPIEQRKISKRLSFSLFQPYKGKLVVSSALALMLLMITILPFKQSNHVYAYLSIDINPSLELGVNKNCQVIELIPYNEDGEKIVSLLHGWEKKDIEDVTSEIMDVIQSQGYLKENHEVILSTVYVNTDKKDHNKHIEKEIAQEMDEVKESVQKKDLEVTVVNGTQKDRKEAMEKGLTTGLYKEISKNTNKKEKKKETKEEKEEKKEIEIPIQQKERPQLGSPTIQQKEQPQQGNPTIQQRNIVEVQPTKPKEAVETVKESTPSIPPGQKKKEDKSNGNFRETEKIKIEQPIEKEDPEKLNTNMKSKEDTPKQTNKENQGNIVEHHKESNVESK